MINKETAEWKPWILLLFFLKKHSLFCFTSWWLEKKRKKKPHHSPTVSRQVVTCGERTQNISHIPPPHPPRPPFPSTVLLCLSSSFSALPLLRYPFFSLPALFLSHHSSVSHKNSGPLRCIYTQLALDGEGLLLQFKTVRPTCANSN